MLYRIGTRGFARNIAGGVALAAALAMATGPAAASLRVYDPPQAPIERRPPSSNAAMSADGDRVSAQTNAPARAGSRGEHLAQWMNQHSSLSPQQQQQALQREPGFRELPSQTQQRMLERLAQLDAMTPEQRQRVLARTEAMEKLNPDQRAEVRSAMSQLGNLPTDQRQMVARTFRALRDLPPEQRISAFASGRYGQLNDQQRAVLLGLLRVEPLLPPPSASTAPAPAPVPSQTFR